MIKLKRGDAAVIHWAFGVDVSDYTSGRFIMRALGADASDDIVVDLDTPIAEQAYDIPLSGTDTAVPGLYRAEVELLPGPHTWPSNGYVDITVLEDLG